MTQNVHDGEHTVMKSLEDELLKLKTGGIPYIKKRIEEYLKSKNTMRPTLDIESVELQIESFDILPTIADMKTRFFINRLVGFALDKGFECKLLEHKLNKVQQTLNPKL